MKLDGYIPGVRNDQLRKEIVADAELIRSVLELERILQIPVLDKVFVESILNRIRIRAEEMQELMKKK